MRCPRGISCGVCDGMAMCAFASAEHEMQDGGQEALKRVWDSTEDTVRLALERLSTDDRQGSDEPGK
ncbi:Uncharacterised protein [Burkholderia cepacia]|nr:hypothetical protein DM41_4098 [Burkholderia cepacia ATCC 25416]SPU74838.1 Uncharacterised protein [Burkholderia cepacia]